MAGRNFGQIQEKGKFDSNIPWPLFIIWESEGGSKQMSFLGSFCNEIVLECPGSLSPASSTLLLTLIINLILSFLRYHEENPRSLKIIF